MVRRGISWTEFQQARKERGGGGRDLLWHVRGDASSSPRAHTTVLKVARTIADLAGCKGLESAHRRGGALSRARQGIFPVRVIDDPGDSAVAGGVSAGTRRAKCSLPVRCREGAQRLQGLVGDGVRLKERPSADPLGIRAVDPTAFSTSTKAARWLSRSAMSSRRFRTGARTFASSCRMTGNSGANISSPSAIDRTISAS